MKFPRLFRNRNKEGNVGISVYGNPSRAGIHVNTPEETMSLPVAYRCVDILSGTIASIPMWHRKREGEIYAIVENSNLNDIFTGSANERQTFFVLMQNAIMSVLLHGNAYIYPVYKCGELKKLYLLNPSSVYYNIEQNVYNINDMVNNVHCVVDANNLIHIKNKSLDGGYLGMSTITYACRTLSVSASADEQTLRELKRGNRLRGIISGGNPVLGMGAAQDSVIDSIGERLNDEIDADKYIIRMPGAVTFTPFSISPADAQLLETRKFNPYDICRFFGVHPDMVFVEQNHRYNSGENSQTTFLNQTLSPLLKQIESEFHTKLIRGSKQMKRDGKVMFDREAIAAMDMKSFSEYIKTFIESGVMSPNEARKMLNRPAIEGGDTFYMTCNVFPLNNPEFAPRQGTNNATKETLIEEELNDGGEEQK